MVEVGKDFESSYRLLMHHKRIVIPLFFSLLLPMLLILLFFQMSGLSALTRELVSLNEEFEQQKTSYLMDLDNMQEDTYKTELIKYLAKDSDDSAYKEEFVAYATSKGYDWSRYAGLINVPNALMLASYLLKGIIGSFYLTCMAYAIIALGMLDEKITLGKALYGANRFFFRLLSLEIIVFIILIAPILLGIGLVAGLFFLNTILGAIATVLLVLVFSAYLIYAGLRLYFIIPAMYVDRQGPIGSIEHSLKVTKGHIFQVLLITLLIFLISLARGVVNQPVSGIFGNLLTQDNMIRVAVSLILMLVFLGLESFVVAFENIFLFYSYVDIKSIQDVKS